MAHLTPRSPQSEAAHMQQEMLDITMFPGTELMTDQRVGSDVTPLDSLIPRPSSDKHDPLNWSPKWKFITLTCATTMSFTLNLGPLANAPMFDEYVKEWGCTLEDAVQFTGVAILVLGFSNFVWVPVSVCYGRRPVMIVSSLVCAISCIWRAQATSYSSFMGASVLNGIAAGPTETLMPQIVTDCMFLHKRGSYNTLYFATYFGALMIGPIVSGAMAYQVGWRSFWWLNTALLVICFSLNLTLFPETRYARARGNEDFDLDQAQIQAPLQAHGKEQGTVADSRGGVIPQTTGAASKSVYSITPASSSFPTGTSQSFGENGSTVEGRNSMWLGKGRPSKEQFKLWQPYQGSLLRELWIPWYLHAFPIVELSAFIVSFSASGYLLVNLTQAQAFAAPPYNYTPQTIGLFNLAVLVGGLIGLITNGPWSDWVAARLTRRNRGVREPEMRLPAMIPYVFVMIIGCVIMAVGYDKGWPWPIIVVIGYGCLGIQVAALPAIASTYAVDSYKPVTGSLFVAITMNKNVWGYGVSKLITPWADKYGFIPPVLGNMALITFFCCCALPFWFYGKKLRGLTKDSFVHGQRAFA